MKILHIRLQNLNSLTGTWHIDFTDPAYTENNLFAITGPTGAGKSTILDAICLALYGQTPRLARISKTSNEIMSRHTGCCFAEVEFKTVQGSYRCHWSQHRSRQKAHGELQPPRHEIADAAGNTILETRIRNVAAKVEAVTGMNFERFTRSTLLAQGGFAAFLDASQNDKAPILEQITGTGIYSRLSIRVHELRLQEQTQLEELDKSLAHMNFLAPADEDALDTLIQERDQQSSLLKSTITTLRKQEGWHKNMASLTHQLSSQQQQLKELEEEEETRTEEFTKLQPALTAQKIEPLYLKQESLLAAQKEAACEKQDISRKLSSHTAQNPQLQKQCTAAVTGLQQTQTAQKSGLQLIERVQKLDHDLETTKEQNSAHTTLLRTQQTQEKKDHTALTGLQQELTQSRKHTGRLDHFFKEHSGTELLVEHFGTIKIQIRSIMDLQDQIRETAQQELQTKRQVSSLNLATARLKKKQESSQREAAATCSLLDKLSLEIETIQAGKETGGLQQKLFQILNRQQKVAELQSFLQDHAQLTAQQQTLQGQLDETTAHHRTNSASLLQIKTRQTAKQQKIEFLEINLRLLARIQSLEEDRKQLEDKSPCPLCGSTDHPYRKGLPPEQSKEETELQKAKDELTEIAQEHQELGRQVTVDGELQKSYSSQIKELYSSLTKAAVEGEGLLSFLDLPSLEQLAPGTMVEEEQQLIDQRQTLERQWDHLEKLRQQQGSARSKSTTLTHTCQELEKELLTADHLASTAIHEKERILLEKETLTNRLASVSDDFSKRLSSYGLSEHAATTLSAIQKNLEKCIAEWKEKKSEAIQLSSQLITLEANISQMQRHHTERLQQITEQKKQCSQIHQDLVQLQHKRATLFGNKETRTERKGLEKAVEEARKTLTKREQELAENEKQLMALRALEKRIQQGETTRNQTLFEQTQRVKQALRDSTFTDMDQFLLARLAPEELEKLQHLHTDLQKRKAALHTLLKDKTATLHKEEEKQLSKELPDQLKMRIQEQEKQLEIIQEQAGAARQQVKQNNQAKASSAVQLKHIAQQKITVGRWNRLHMLIGSADGKKFRNFAQGLTFEMMINHANKHLTRMNDRYILVRDKEQALNLNVIDTWQAGEIRSTRNLSGGESFLVSLALALGLSRMASHNVRVDSLFLDEGFGTLDEETLEAALEALAGLREENKLIGIISHVRALKERIPLQLEVLPGSGGRSTLTGAGVSLHV